MKGKRLWNIISIAVFSLQLIVQLLTAYVVWKLDMLPTVYAVPLLAGFSLLSVFTALLFFVPSRRNKVYAGRKVVACIFALLIVCGCAAVSVVISDLYNTMQEVTNPEPAGIIRSIYVRVDDPAQTLTDTRTYRFGRITNYDAQYTDVAVKAIEQQLGGSIATKSYPSASDMVDALLNGEIEAMILNEAYVAVIEEDENYSDFSQKVRRLCDVAIEIQIDQEEEEKDNSKPDFHAPKRITSAPFIMYISGSDTLSAKLDVSRSDVNILMVVNPVTKQVLLINTPRDYYVPNPAGNGALDKLTHCGIYGVDCSIEALSDLYEAEVDYYTQINFTGFETLINAIDGVTVYSDVAFTASTTYIQQGENHLYGADALNFARERYNLSGGDNARGRNQMKVIKAVIEKMTSGTTLIKNYTEILESLEGMFVTDLQSSDISKLVKMQLSDMASWDVKTYAVVGTGGSERTYSMPGSYAYVMYPNEASVARAQMLIQKVMNGKDLTDADITFP